MTKADAGPFEVYGGELIHPSGGEFKNPKDVHVLGPFETYEEAHATWKSEAFRTIDNALMRYRIRRAQTSSVNL